MDKGQLHGKGHSQEEWLAIGILQMAVDHPKRLIVDKLGGMGLVLPLWLPASPPVQPTRSALLGEKVDPASQQSVELVETSEGGIPRVCCRLPLQWVETFFRVAQVPFPDKIVLVAH